MASKDAHPHIWGTKSEAPLKLVPHSLVRIVFSYPEKVNRSRLGYLPFPWGL
jgi:hypothetical protein